MAPAVIIASCRLTEVDAPVDAVPDEVPGVGFGARCENFGSLVDVVRDRRCGPPKGFGAEGGRLVSPWVAVILSAGFCPSCGNVIRAG